MLVALQGKITQTYLMVELYTHCSMNKQCVKEIQKLEKAHLQSVGNIAMWFYHSLEELETMSFLFKEEEAIRGGKWVFGNCHVTPYKTCKLSSGDNNSLYPYTSIVYTLNITNITYQK